MAQGPSFQFYATDWAHSVSSLTLEERGAYITFLAWSWEHGQLPNDMKRLAVILGVHIGHAKRVCVEVLKRWHVDPDTGQWFNRRLEKTREQQRRFVEKQRANGKLGGRPPKQNPGITQAEPKPVAKKSSPISDLQTPDQNLDQEQREDAPDVHAVLVRLAHEVLDGVESGRISEAEAKDELKDRAGAARIQGYNATAITKALESALFQRKRRRNA